MMPMAEELLMAPLPRAETAVVREMLSGCQYFDARSALNAMSAASNTCTLGECMDNLRARQLPAPRCWFQITDDSAVILSEPIQGTPGENRFLVNCMFRHEGRIFCVFRGIAKSGTGMMEFRNLQKDAFMSIEGGIHLTSRFIRPAQFVLATLFAEKQGFCHRVSHEPSRQQRRLNAREGRPCHKWVEIRLGRPRWSRKPGAGGEPRRGVAWHWRNGHPLNHPNPNQPKWRAGCWVGSPDNGIRSHDYIIDPDGWLDD